MTLKKARRQFSNVHQKDVYLTYMSENQKERANIKAMKTARGLSAFDSKGNRIGTIRVK